MGSFQVIEYIFRQFFAFIVYAFCYITNPIVVLFCDEYGNLPKYFRLWQTYDNCLDVEWLITEKCVPKIFRYDFNKHYKYHLEDKTDGKLIAGYVDLLDPNFSTVERIQRYFCRLLWLCRNNAYGFRYYIFGKEVNALTAKLTHQSDYGITVKAKNAFCYKYAIPWLYIELKKGGRIYYKKEFILDIFIGYKIQSLPYLNDVHRCMLAFRFSPFRHKK